MCLLKPQAKQQPPNVAQLPFIFKWVAAMPDVHWGIGATVGSVIPTKGAIIPAAVGVDIGCGMMAVQTELNALDLPENLKGDSRGNREGCAARPQRTTAAAAIAVPAANIPARNMEVWQTLKPALRRILEKASEAGSRG